AAGRGGAGAAARSRARRARGTRRGRAGGRRHHARALPLRSAGAQQDRDRHRLQTRRGVKRAAVLALVLFANAAHAERPAAGIDVADLPPLPAESEDPSSSATLFAASATEEDVVVGAAKREQSLGSVASAVTVVSGDRLRRFGYRTVGEALAAVAGVYLADSRVSYSLGIRGLN